MKKSFFIKTVFVIVFQFYMFNLNAQITVDQLFENTYQLYEAQRYSNGVYRDSKLISGNDFHPCSVANVGTGLVSLCIADEGSFITDAEAKVVQTLRTILGYTPGFNPDRNNKGFYRHFIDLDTGARAWDSEYSTIDTALLAVGALFAKKYFSSNTEIAGYADELFLSIDWVAAIQNASTGTIWLEQDASGNGQGAAAAPFNEYMIVAYLAMKSEGNVPGDGTTAWNVWTQLNNFAYANYQGYQLLADFNSANAYLSNFVIQFPYYLIPWTYNNTLYETYMSNAALADQQYYSNITGNYPPGQVNAYEWGLGAGSSPTEIGGVTYTASGYNADKISNHPAHVVSPHIIAGFLPVDSSGKSDLEDMLAGSKGLYDLSTGETLLWRYSLDEPTWIPNAIQGIDYSSMLYGLAYDKFGDSFFATYNDYDFPDPLAQPAPCVDPVISNFECSTPSHPFSGNGLVEIANPFQGGINTSANVGQFTDDGLNPWDNLSVDFGAPIDLSVNSILHVNVYAPSAVVAATPIPIVAKIEGSANPLELPAVMITANDEWQELTFDFSAAAGAGNDKLVLFFNFANNNGSGSDVYYLDDYFFAPAPPAPPVTCVYPVISDFECHAPSHPFSGDIQEIANPFPGGINTSTNVGQFTDDGLNPWDNLFVDFGAPIDLSVNSTLYVKIYAPSAVVAPTPIPFVAKVEGSANPFETSPVMITAYDEWQELTFDLSSAAGAGNDKLVLFFNFANNNGSGSDIYYIDDYFFGAPTLSTTDVTLDNAVTVFPNPAKDEVNVNSKVNITAYELIDITGKIIIQKESKTFEPSFKIDISTLKTGLYFLNVRSSTSNKVVKILKK